MGRHCKCGHSSEPASDRYGDPGFDTERHRFLEKPALLSGPNGFWCATAPTEEFVLMACSSDDWIDLLITEIEISVSPGSWIRGYQRRYVVGQTQIGKPSKAKALCNSPRNSFEAEFILGGLDGVSKFLKGMFDWFHDAQPG